MKYKDKPMHGTKIVESGYLWWYQYHIFTRRWYYIFGIPVWYVDINNEDRPMQELIKKAVGE